MYYYPDVERYYIHADNRDLHAKFLTSTDEKSDEEGRKSMDVGRYPFGLRSRRKRLETIYRDVPFTEKIDDYPTSADKKIDDCIIGLREYLDKLYKREYDAFMNSEEVVTLKKEIEEIDSQIASIPRDEKDELDEDSEVLVELLYARKEKVSEELEKLIQSFTPECPAYINRSTIYNEWCVANQDEQDELLRIQTSRYEKLVLFAKSKKFFEFVKVSSLDSSANGNDSVTDVRSLDDASANPGCLFSWLPFFNRKKECAQSLSEQCDAATELKPNQALLSRITSIKEQLDLKECFVAFEDEVDAIEGVYEDEKKYCDNFKITTHTNYYYSLINLKELAEKQVSTSEARLQESISTWRDKKQPLKSDLISIVEKKASKHTKDCYSFIDWDNPTSFIQDVSCAKNLSEVCNELQKRSAPIVNYNLTSEVKENKVVRYFFSDIPYFEEKMQTVRPNLHNGNELSVTTSVHTASKICMFQFLPMDEDVLSNLVDLQYAEPENGALVGWAEDLLDDTDEAD